MNRVPSVPASRRSVPRRARVRALVALAVVVLAGCGVDTAKVATSPTTVPGTPPTEPAATTTTEEEPGFTLPSIPTGEPGTTQTTRERTSTTEPTTEPGSGEPTPHGLTEAKFARDLHDQAGLSVRASECTARRSFAEFDPADLDAIYEADDEDQVDPVLVLQFTAIVMACAREG